MSKPAVYDLEIYRGDDFDQTFRLRQRNSDGTWGAYLDLTGATLKAQTRINVDDTAYVDLNPVLGTPTAGEFTISMSSAVTATLMDGWWDIQVTIAGKKRTRMRGRVTVTADVSR